MSALPSAVRSNSTGDVKRIFAARSAIQPASTAVAAKISSSVDWTVVPVGSASRVCSRLTPAPPSTSASASLNTVADRMTSSKVSLAEPPDRLWMLLNVTAGVSDWLVTSPASPVIGTGVPANAFSRVAASLSKLGLPETGIA